MSASLYGPNSLSRQSSLSSSCSCSQRCPLSRQSSIYSSTISIRSRTPPLEWSPHVVACPAPPEESTQSTLGLWTPQGSQNQNDGFGYLCTEGYEDNEIRAAVALQSLGIVPDGTLRTTWNLGASQTSNESEDEEEMTDTDSGIETEVETETEMERGAHDTDSMRTLVELSTQSQSDCLSYSGFGSTIYPDQVGTPLPRVAWSSTCGGGVLNGGAGVRMSDFLLEDYFVQARDLRTPSGSGYAPDRLTQADIDANDSDDDNVALGRMTLLSTSFGLAPFITELHWPDCEPTCWLYAARPTTTFRQYFYFVAVMLQMWLRAQDSIWTSIWSGNIGLENLRLYSLRCIGQDERGRNRWVLDLNVVKD